MKDAIIEILKWVRESVRSVVVILILSTLVLFFPNSWLAATGLGESFVKYRFIAFLTFAGALVWLLTFPVEKWYHLSGSQKRLNRLTEDEKNTLRFFIQNAKRTQCIGWMHVAVARSLASVQILTETSTKDGHGNPYFEINSWAYSHLSRHPELVGLPKK